MEYRREERLPIESAVLPFLGSRDEDFQPFQYLIQDFSQNGVKIAIPSWVQTREKLFQADRVNLHLPYKFGGKSRNQGSIAWEKWDSEMESQVYGVALNSHFPETYPVYISLESREVVVDLAEFTSPDKILTLVLKDSLLLKKGMLIYLDHLTAYFTRVADFNREDYQEFRNAIISEIKKELQKNTAYLTEIYSRAKEDQNSDFSSLDWLDIEELRASMESEIYMDLFSSVLDSEVIVRYLMALKILEKKMYNNYNTLVMLYLRTFN